MHLAYLVNQYPSISHTFIRREILALERQGHVVERFTIRQSSTNTIDEQDRAEAAKTTVILRGWPCLVATLTVMFRHPIYFANATKLMLQFRRHAGQGTIRHLAYLAEGCRLLLELRRRDVQWLHAHFGTNSATVAALCRRLGGPRFSFTVHGPEEFDKPLSEALTLKVEHADQVFAISSFGLSQLQRWCSFREWGKLKIVRCGLDESSFDSTQGEAPEGTQMVCVARLVEQKGLFCLLEAARLLAREGHDFEILVIGDGPLRPELEKVIEATHITSHVRLLGWLSGKEINAHLKSSRCLVLPSYAEGLPVTIMEALAAGRPVISTYVAGIPELVIAGENGWLCPAGNPTLLADAMRTCLETSASDLANLGNNGRAAVKRMHSVDEECRKLARYFE